MESNASPKEGILMKRFVAIAVVAVLAVGLLGMFGCNKTSTTGTGSSGTTQQGTSGSGSSGSGSGSTQQGTTGGGTNLGTAGQPGTAGGTSGGSGGSSSVGKPPTNPSTGLSTGIMIQNLAFNPATATIKAGGAVSWTNADSVPHTVTGDGVNSGTIAPGKIFTMTFTTPGTYAYHCTIHPQMTGTIIVK
jgi:plastocyanin